VQVIGSAFNTLRFILNVYPASCTCSSTVVCRSFSLLHYLISLDFSEGSEYTTCTGLVTHSDQPFTNSSIFEINAAGVSLDKIVMGKPATASDASGFVDPSILATCVQQAKDTGWSAGVMVWQVSGACLQLSKMQTDRMVSVSFVCAFALYPVSERCGELDQDRTIIVLARMRELVSHMLIVFTPFTRALPDRIRLSSIVGAPLLRHETQ
jgi:hypothetical protein